jgi:hypothetical protein
MRSSMENKLSLNKKKNPQAFIFIDGFGNEGGCALDKNDETINRMR